MLHTFSPKAFSYAGRDLQLTRNRWHSRFWTAANPKRSITGPLTLLKSTLRANGYNSFFETFDASATGEAPYGFEDGLISVFELAS
jgi:hypothetical protein